MSSCTIHQTCEDCGGMPVDHWVTSIGDPSLGVIYEGPGICEKCARLRREADRRAGPAFNLGAGKFLTMEPTMQMGNPSCPCYYLEPCSYACPCRNSFMSGGCERCCNDGSPEQRKARAEEIAHKLDNPVLYGWRPFWWTRGKDEPLIWIVDWPDTDTAGRVIPGYYHPGKDRHYSLDGHSWEYGAAYWMTRNEGEIEFTGRAPSIEWMRRELDNIRRANPGGGQP